MRIDPTSGLAAETVNQTAHLMKHKLGCLASEDTFSGPTCQRFLTKSYVIVASMAQAFNRTQDYQAIVPHIAWLQQLNREMADLKPGRVVQGYKEAPMLWEALGDLRVLLACALGFAAGYTVMHQCAKHALPRLRRLS